MNFEVLTEEIQQIIITFGLFMIMIWLLTILLIWFFIKSAVRTGVEEALEKITVNVNLNSVTDGIVINTKDVTPQNYSTGTKEIYSDMPFLE